MEPSGEGNKGGIFGKIKKLFGGGSQEPESQPEITGGKWDRSKEDLMVMDVKGNVGTPTEINMNREPKINPSEDQARIIPRPDTETETPQAPDKLPGSEDQAK
jgi:hypothetical protein